jgi:tRNA-5-methyluridine54 2-sulfurtransferase
MPIFQCRKCGAKAVINMKQHRLAFCREHYLEWMVDATIKNIDRYHLFKKDEKVLVAVSGGKDSLALWDILWRAGYQADGIYICLGVDDGIQYSARSQELTEKFAAERNLLLHIVNIPETYGETIPQMAERDRRGQGKPCAVCGLVKRHVMNRIAVENGYSVLATGHNLDDEVAVLLGNTLTWSLDLLQRQAPLLPAADGFARKVKPLCRFAERETAAYTLLRKIDYIFDECPYAVGNKSASYKHLLNQLEEEMPGKKLKFYTDFLQSKKAGLLDGIHPEKPDYSQTCPICHQPTTIDGPCTFCKLVGAQKKYFS